MEKDQFKKILIYGHSALMGDQIALTPRTHGFNAKIGFEKYAPTPKILPKTCLKSALQTKPAKFDTILPISRDLVHIFQS